MLSMKMLFFPTLGLKKKGKRVLMKIIKIKSNSHKFLQLKPSVWIDQDRGSKWVPAHVPPSCDQTALEAYTTGFPKPKHTIQVLSTWFECESFDYQN